MIALNYTLLSVQIFFFNLLISSVKETLKDSELGVSFLYQLHKWCSLYFQNKIFI